MNEALNADSDTSDATDRFADRVVSVAAYVDPVEADAVSNFLNSNGVQARVVGDFTANFQVEIASEIQVVVNLPQLERGRNLLAKFEASQNSVDWAKVDVGDSTTIEADESSYFAEANESSDPESPKRRWFQFNLFTLICVQTAIAIAAGILATLSVIERSLALTLAVFPAVLAATFVGIVIATTYMAKNMSRKAGKKFIVAGMLLYFAFSVFQPSCCLASTDGLLRQWAS